MKKQEQTKNQLQNLKKHQRKKARMQQAQIQGIHGKRAKQQATAKKTRFSKKALMIMGALVGTSAITAASLTPVWMNMASQSLLQAVSGGGIGGGGIPAPLPPTPSPPIVPAPPFPAKNPVQPGGNGDIPAGSSQMPNHPGWTPSQVPSDEMFKIDSSSVALEKSTFSADGVDKPLAFYLTFRVVDLNADIAHYFQLVQKQEKIAEAKDVNVFVSNLIGKIKSDNDLINQWAFEGDAYLNNWDGFISGSSATLHVLLKDSDLLQHSDYGNKRIPFLHNNTNINMENDTYNIGVEIDGASIQINKWGHLQPTTITQTSPASQSQKIKNDKGFDYRKISSNLEYTDYQPDSYTMKEFGIDFLMPGFENVKINQPTIDFKKQKYATGFSISKQDKNGNEVSYTNTDLLRMKKIVEAEGIQTDFIGNTVFSTLTTVDNPNKIKALPILELSLKNGKIVFSISNKAVDSSEGMNLSLSGLYSMIGVTWIDNILAYHFAFGVEGNTSFHFIALFGAGSGSVSYKNPVNTNILLTSNELDSLTNGSQFDHQSNFFKSANQSMDGIIPVNNDWNNLSPGQLAAEGWSQFSSASNLEESFKDSEILGSHDSWDPRPYGKDSNRDKPDPNILKQKKNMLNLDSDDDNNSSNLYKEWSVDE